VAVVTGASRGIGRAIAVALAQAGADVVCTARSTEAQPHKVLPGTIEDTARKVQALGRRALAIPVDVSKEDEVEAMTRRVLDEFGRLDILVNNAAIAAPGSFLEVPVRRWDLVMNVNLRGAYLCARASPSMIEKKADAPSFTPRTWTATGAGVLGVEGGDEPPTGLRPDGSSGHHRERAPDRAPCHLEALSTCRPALISRGPPSRWGSAGLARGP
jgi:NAD(P)-dependent dehydrogenase (short-subunit alcohol dehydrogenase family)